eukprot:CAMPEP_0185269492 /NCGR_PEP_ID=MMETSP1359-20130426/40021_1 /TAXON_ID=552665 /ORGANISM="Bigelowiella longifila, Strain CCMP242" /LENGTH=175 /DNA_ID=CAMNT_0027860695 /DNA_START=135 /DNA_END=662 /DNA_ORIENTATION=+
MGSNKNAYTIGDDDDDDDDVDEEAAVAGSSESHADYKTFAGAGPDDESNKSKGFFELLNAAQGIHKASELLKGNEDSARCFQFALRLIGWLMMFFGLYCIFEPLTALLDIIPIVGPVVRASIFLLCLIVTLLLSMVIISVAWFSSRPKLVIGFLVVVVAVCGGIIWWRNLHSASA